MLDEQIKTTLGELVFQLSISQARIRELENQLKEKDGDSERTEQTTVG